LAAITTGVGLAAQPAPDLLVERNHSGPRVDQEQRDVGLAHRRTGLRAHAAGQRIGVFILIARGIDDPEVEPEQVRLALAPVAGHAGAIVDQRQPPADQAIEQGGFADIRPADNGDGGQLGHGLRPCPLRG
jgi:hypothetical protein